MLCAVAAASKANDVLWFFFAGHGSQQKDRDGDEEDGKDEIIMPADYDLEADYISDDWFKSSSFRGAIDKKAETVAVFDCCHSGTMFDLPWTMQVDGNNDKWKRVKGQPDNKDDGFFFYLSGCQDAQTSAELTQTRGGKTTRNGAMTQGLTNMIRKNAMEKKTIREFLEDLRKIVGKHMSSDGNAQKPNICCTHPFDLNKTSFKQMFDGEVPQVK